MERKNIAMKMKKLKKLLKAINDIAARPVEDIKGIIKRLSLC